MDIENTKLPPNSIDSEQSVLGGLLLHNDSWDKVVNIISTNDFYQASHRIIYEAIVTLLEHDKPADILTVKEQVIKTHDEDSMVVSPILLKLQTTLLRCRILKLMQSMSESFLYTDNL